MNFITIAILLLRKPDKQFKASGIKQKFQTLQDMSSGVPASSVPHQD
jgi:hypothetical protein